MAERFEKVFSLPENLYAAGSPVIIAAGALQKDNQTGKIFAQLKLQNIASATIKAVKIQLSLFDTASQPLSNKVDYQYLDVESSCNQTFGEKMLIPIEDNSACSFSVAVTEVVFADQEIWRSSEESWEQIPSLSPLNYVTAKNSEQTKIEEETPKQLAEGVVKGTAKKKKNKISIFFTFAIVAIIASSATILGMKFFKPQQGTPIPSLPDKSDSKTKDAFVDPIIGDWEAVYYISEDGDILDKDDLDYIEVSQSLSFDEKYGRVALTVGKNDNPTKFTFIWSFRETKDSMRLYTAETESGDFFGTFGLKDELLFMDFAYSETTYVFEKS